MVPQTAGQPGETAGCVAPQERDFSPSAKKAALRVLVVDDESLVRWSVSETLSALGYDVIEAGDGASAVRAMTRPGAADVVLLDLRLPDSSDLRVLEAMRRVAPSIPIILMTAFGTPDVVDEALRRGAFSVVAKPFEMNELNPMVTRALSSARPS